MAFNYELWHGDPVIWHSQHTGQNKCHLQEAFRVSMREATSRASGESMQDQAELGCT